MKNVLVRHYDKNPGKSGSEHPAILGAWRTKPLPQRRVSGCGIWWMGSQPRKTSLSQFHGFHPLSRPRNVCRECLFMYSRTVGGPEPETPGKFFDIEGGWYHVARLGAQPVWQTPPVRRVPGGLILCDHAGDISGEGLGQCQRHNLGTELSTKIPGGHPSCPTMKTSSHPNCTKIEDAAANERQTALGEHRKE
ncbi:hypothetical protein M407DRAFT_11409 [Tulasnella calospora MUT 4182]|uniref:Uncharacterized protein n=1 Tax=Tulasnella calospora MUT 4182 TaxID=1051891 RepID=A0A0C3KD96_9AGAM|nr:hypothetical protein M407DRAFT_11409 [Tulasnella calospora MUT 4182]